jgi:hypothetical protein
MAIRILKRSRTASLKEIPKCPVILSVFETMSRFVLFIIQFIFSILIGLFIPANNCAQISPQLQKIIVAQSLLSMRI